MSYPSYPKYQESRTEWLGYFPSHWVEVRFKYLFTLQKRPVRSDDDIVTCFRDGEVTLRKNRRTEGFTNAVQETGYQGVRTGDLVIHAMDAFAGAIGVSDSDGKSSPVYSVCTKSQKKIETTFYAYLLRYMALSGFISSLAKGIRERSTDFRWSDASGLFVPLPPSKEQGQIARFLDHQTARIDALIAEQQRLIELLKEKRQAVISHAVTKGLDPDVAMKDSGVEWLGEIPAHWQIKRLKHVISAIGGSTPSKDRPEFWGGSIPWVSPKDMKVKVINQTIDQITEEAVLENNLSLAESGMVLIVVRGMILAHSLPLAITGSEVALNQDMKALKAENFINSEYLFDVLSGIRDIAFEFVDSSAHGTRRLEWERFREILLPIPPLSEQRELSHRINAAKGKIDQLSQEAQRAIGLLQERRSTLISAAVTGKIDVRNWEPPVSETFPQSTPSEEAPA